MLENDPTLDQFDFCKFSDHVSAAFCGCTPALYATTAPSTASLKERCCSSRSPPPNHLGCHSSHHSEVGAILIDAYSTGGGDGGGCFIASVQQRTGGKDDGLSVPLGFTDFEQSVLHRVHELHQEEVSLQCFSAIAVEENACSGVVSSTGEDDLVCVENFHCAQLESALSPLACLCDLLESSATTNNCNRTNGEISSCLWRYCGADGAPHSSLKHTIGVLRPTLPTHTVDEAVVALTDLLKKNEEEESPVKCVFVGQMAKSIAFFVDGQPVVVVLSGDRNVAPRLLARGLKSSQKKTKTASPQQCVEVFGYAPGCMPPFGHRSSGEDHLFSSPPSSLLSGRRSIVVVLDSSLMRFDTLYVGTGEHGSLLAVSRAQLMHLVPASSTLVGSVSKERRKNCPPPPPPC